MKNPRMFCWIAFLSLSVHCLSTEPRRQSHQAISSEFTQISMSPHLFIFWAHLAHQHCDVVRVPHPRVAGEILQNHHGLVEASDCLHHPEGYITVNVAQWWGGGRRWGRCSIWVFRNEEQEASSVVTVEMCCWCEGRSDFKGFFKVNYFFLAHTLPMCKDL